LIRGLWRDFDTTTELTVAFSRCLAIGCGARAQPLEEAMHGIIYLVGLIVVIMAILSFFGLR
jgi:hypothetical protein